MGEKEIRRSLLQGTFSLEKYEKQVLSHGLNAVWKVLVSALRNLGVNGFSAQIDDFYGIGRLYEYGLAVENKASKKRAGKYYTPRDVAGLMADLLIEGEVITRIADVGCGCGNLIIEVLSRVRARSEEEFQALSREIYLFDLDKTALEICKARIEAMFGIPREIIHVKRGDFLSKHVQVPKDCFVISNPPYAQIKEIKGTWQFKMSISESKDLYVGFIEKMIRTAKKAVVVSPQSYIVGDSFSSLRGVLFKSGNGEIYSFDNVPGTLFSGRKQGVFNTNTANSVRASILTFRRSQQKGYRLTHLIRFSAEQRSDVVNIAYVKQQLGVTIQDLSRPLKCFRELEPFVRRIEGNGTFADLVESDPNRQMQDLSIYVNSSARYFIVGSARKLKRDGVYQVFAKDHDSYLILYALLNSSFAYLWWRMLDGGILIPKSLLLKIPLPAQLDINQEVVDFCNELMADEKDFLVYKKNAGVIQESVKIPASKRNHLNRLLFGDVPFDLIHSNKEIIEDAGQ